MKGRSELESLAQAGGAGGGRELAGLAVVMGGYWHFWE